MSGAAAARGRRAGARGGGALKGDSRLAFTGAPQGQRAPGGRLTTLLALGTRRPPRHRASAPPGGRSLTFARARQAGHYSDGFLTNAATSAIVNPGREQRPPRKAPWGRAGPAPRRPRSPGSRRCRYCRAPRHSLRGGRRGAGAARAARAQRAPALFPQRRRRCLRGRGARARGASREACEAVAAEVGVDDGGEAASGQLRLQSKNLPNSGQACRAERTSASSREAPARSRAVSADREPGVWGTWRMDLLSLIHERTLLLDGGMGLALTARGFTAGECPEEWNVTHAAEVRRHSSRLLRSRLGHREHQHLRG